MTRNALYQLTLVKIREMIREPEAMFWIFIFPVVLAVALGIAFRSSGPATFRVGVEHGEGAEWVRSVLASTDGLEAAMLDPDEARSELRSGRLALVAIAGDPWTYWYDPTRPESREARLLVDSALQTAAGRRDPRDTATRELTERGSRYIDFLIPGLLGMNLMGTGMWGIGFYVVNMRSKRLLKRMVATPMSKWQFLFGQITGRLVFLILEVGVLVLFARWAFGVPFRGSVAGFAVISVLGAMTFAGIGLLVASRARTIEGVSGLMNLVMMPMWIMSGIFFSTSRFPDEIQPLVRILPLTAINDALRAVMIDGRTLLSLSGELVVATAWCVGAFLAALVSFRWE